MDTPPTEHATIRRHITPKEVDTLVRLPFEVPKQTERIELSFRRSDRQSSIRVGLFDQDRLRGLWGGDRAVAFVARESASPGIERGPVVPGGWAFQLLPVRIGPAGCDVEVELTFRMKHLRWLKGDIHMHTDHSDGRDETAFVVDRCRALGLDYIAITDHDVRTCHDFLPYRPDITVLPGIELSSHRGHANCIGVDGPYTNGMFSTEEEVREALQSARDKGCFISINHPFDWDPGCQWRWSWNVPFDGIEIVNGPYRPTNARAMEWWQKKLVSGEQLAVVGGSDAHNTYELTLTGMPTTWVHVEENSREAIVAALRKGNSFLTISPKGPTLEMPGYTLGEIVRPKKGASMIVPVDIRLNPGSVVRIITRQGTVVEKKVECEEFHHDLEMKVEGNDFARVEAWEYMEEYDRSMLTLLSNPVYIRPE